tara:strand:- start:1862 stop:3910 length:2049 start_codon:yes stop_codon:yes gene_type:complete
MSNFPLLKFCVVFIAGILYSFHFQVNSNGFIVSFFSFLIITFFLEFLLKPTFSKKKYLLEILLISSIFFAGITIFIIQTDYNKNNYIGNILNLIQSDSSLIEVQIISPIFKNGKYVKCKVEVKNIKNNEVSYSTTGKSLIYLNNDSSSLKLLPGDKLLIRSSLKKISLPNNPGQFNYSKYLKNQEVEYSCYVKDSWEYLSSDITLKRLAAICRNYCINVFYESSLEQHEFALATALTFGYRDNLDKEIKKSFSNTGVMHILAVSGLHVGILYMVIVFLFKLINFSHRFKWIKSLCVFLIIWSFAFITGLSSSVIRAVTMLSFFVIADLFNRETNIYNILAGSAILMLFFNPLLITQVSFQLSYIAVIGILYIYPKIEKLIKVKHWLFNYFWKLSAVSIAAQITTFPLGLYYFHQFPNYFLVTNLFIIPLAFLLFVMGLIVITFSYSSIIISISTKVISVIVNFMLFLLETINQLPGSIVKGISINTFELILIYLAIGLFFIFIYCKKSVVLYVWVFTMFLLFYIDFKEDLRLLKQKKIIVYNIKNHFAVDLIDGKNHYFIADQLLQSPRLIEQNIKNNWDNLDLNPAILINVDSIISKTILWEGKRLAFIDNLNKEVGKFDVGFLFEKTINKHKTNSVSEDDKLVSFSGKVFINSFSKDSQNTKNNSSFFDISNSGAYIHEI